MKLRYLLLAVAAGVAGTLLVTSAFSASSSEKNVLYATMLGKKEVGADGKKGAGDRDGRGGFTAVVDGDQICVAMAVKNIGTPTLAHIHRGRPSVAGPPVVPASGSFTVPSRGDPGASSDCETIDPGLARQIQKNPGKFYANVHNSEFPGGAVRGQLFARRK